MVVSSAVLGQVIRIPRKVRSDEALFPTVPALAARTALYRPAAPALIQRPEENPMPVGHADDAFRCHPQSRREPTAGPAPPALPAVTSMVPTPPYSRLQNASPGGPAGSVADAGDTGTIPDPRASEQPGLGAATAQLCPGAGSRRHGDPGPPRRPAPGSPCSPKPERPGRSQGPAQLKVNKYVGKKEKMLLHFQPPVLVHGRQKTKA